jgi:transposase
VLSLSPAVKLWYCPEAVDMRLGFDGLFALVRNRLKADPLSGHLFIFRNKTADRLKVLYWGGHGLCLWCQRLEAGRYHFPNVNSTDSSLELSAGQFQMILDGIDLSRVQRFKRFSTPCGEKSATCPP